MVQASMPMRPVPTAKLWKATQSQWISELRNKRLEPYRCPLA